MILWKRSEKLRFRAILWKLLCDLGQVIKPSEPKFYWLSIEIIIITSQKDHECRNNILKANSRETVPIMWSVNCSSLTTLPVEHILMSLFFTLKKHACQSSYYWTPLPPSTGVSSDKPRGKSWLWKFHSRRTTFLKTFSWKIYN